VAKKYAILDTSWSLKKQTYRGMAAKYLKWELDRHGLEEYPHEEADIILMTAVSVDGIKLVRRVRKMYPNKTIVLGGAAGTYPSCFSEYVDIVCVGDGQSLLHVLFTEGVEAAKRCPNAFVRGEERVVEVDSNFPYNMPPMQVDSGEVEVWCGRGCKKRCAFCQTGWAYEYSENPDPETLITQINSLKRAGKNVAYLSNDASQHSFFNALPKNKYGSYSVDYIKRNGSPQTREVRLGVEGVSERLRKSVYKPITREDLIEVTAGLTNSGHTVRWFMIAGLPGETDADWEELKTCIQEWKRRSDKQVLTISFTAFYPQPATPFKAAALDDGYQARIDAFLSWFWDGPECMRTRRGYSEHIRIWKPEQPKNRLERAKLYMDVTEEELYRGGYTSPNNRIRYAHMPPVIGGDGENAHLQA